MERVNASNHITWTFIGTCSRAILRQFSLEKDRASQRKLMDPWAIFDALKAQFIPSLLDDAEKWLAYATNSAWLWFLFAIVAALVILRRFVVRPLSRLIDNRTEVNQLDSMLHILTNEVKYVRLAVDELRSLLSSLKEEHEAVADMRLLADELRAIVSSLRNDRSDGELRHTIEKIHSALNSLKSEHDERGAEMRSGLNSLISEYEQAKEARVN